MRTHPTGINDAPFFIRTYAGGRVAELIRPAGRSLPDDGMTTYLILGFTYAFAAAVQPGPFLTYLISRTLRTGWRRTIPAALAPLLSDVPIVILVLLVLTRLPPWLEHLLRLCGGAFLLYLAADAYRSWRVYRPDAPIESQPPSRTIFEAVSVNLLNPNPYIGWSLIMGPLLLQAWRQNHAYGIALLATFYSTMVLSLAVIIFTFGGAKNFAPRLSRMLIALSAVGLALFGCYQLYMGAISLFG